MLCCCGWEQKQHQKGQVWHQLLEQTHVPPLPLSSTHGYDSGAWNKSYSVLAVVSKAAATGCSSCLLLEQLYTRLDDAGSSLSFWLSSCQGWTAIFFFYCQQELSTADAWSGRFALTLTLLLLPAHHKNCSLLWPWKLSATRRGQLKTRKEEPVTTACSVPTRGFATQHHKTRNVTLQKRQHVATRWSRDSPQQHASISPHHQSYPGSEWGSNKEMGKKSIIETKYQTCNSM